MTETTFKDACVLGCGISGLAMARWLKEYNIDFVAIERTDAIGGLWKYRDNANYGVMKFTHINVSKYNYCYSDHQFPEGTPDYPDHYQMYNYIESYAKKHSLYDYICFNTEVLSVEECRDFDENIRPKSSKVQDFGKFWKVHVKDTTTGKEHIYVTPYLCVASGHHGTPLYAKFPGQETFTGELIHSVEYKSATVNKYDGKKVLIVGIGNSAVDAATNLVNEGRCPEVCISTRSGAWVIPNYFNGYATDLYACRAFLSMPWQVSNFIFEQNIKFIYGNPEKYNLNPKMRALQTQPTLNPTLIHHIQRKNITIRPNIKSIHKDEVTFENGEKASFDAIILCTGYSIDLKYFDTQIREQLFVDKEETILNLYKNVFHPMIGPSLSFIGFIQPTSGGILTASEIQSRWVVYLMTRKTSLPEPVKMFEEIKNDQQKISKRFYKSARLTLQKDPILYNDEIASFFSAKPSLWDFRNIGILWRLMFSSCGPAQWRLSGPDRDENAFAIVKRVPLTPMMDLFGKLILAFLVFLVLLIINSPLLALTTFGLSYFIYKQLND